MADVSSPSAGLAMADLAIYTLLLPVAVCIAWTHGRTGLACWPILLAYFGQRFVADIYQIVHRHDPPRPNGILGMTSAGSLACLSLAIIGLVYEA